MAAPDSLPYLMTASAKRSRERQDAANVGRTDSWPSITGLIWAGLDCASVIVAGLIAFRIRLDVSIGGPAEHAVRAFPPGMLFLYLLLYSVYLVLFGRTYGLYRPMEKRSGLNEQRMTVQASLTAGLLLCGTLYLLRAYAISRLVVLFTVVLTTVFSDGAARRVAESATAAVPRGDRDAQCADRGRGASGAGVAEPH